jgi:hypothetical protein
MVSSIVPKALAKLHAVRAWGIGYCARPDMAGRAGRRMIKRP